MEGILLCVRYTASRQQLFSVMPYLRIDLGIKVTDLFNTIWLPWRQKKIITWRFFNLINNDLLLLPLWTWYGLIVSLRAGLQISRAWGIFFLWSSLLQLVRVIVGKLNGNLPVLSVDGEYFNFSRFNCCLWHTGSWSLRLMNTTKKAISSPHRHVCNPSAKSFDYWPLWCIWW